MKIVCEKCTVEHELDPPAWVVASGRPFRFRCSRCGHSQMVAASGSAAASPASAPTMPAPAPAPVPEAVAAPPATTAPAPPSEQGGAPVYLKQEGKVYLVRDWATVQRWIMERRVERDDLVSEGGVRWETIGSRPELGSFFAAVDQLDAAEGEGATAPTAAPAPAPAPSPFANPFPFSDEARDDSKSRFARLDDDTEGVPTGLPPLPTEDAPGAAPEDVPDVPGVRAASPRMAEPTPPPEAAPPAIVSDYDITPPPPIDRDIPPPGMLPTPPISPRVDPYAVTRPAMPSPLSAPAVPPAPVEEPVFAMSDGDTAEAEPALASDPFAQYGQAAPVEDDWDAPKPRGNTMVWIAVFAITALALVVGVAAVVFITQSNNGTIAVPPVDEPQLEAVLDPSEGTPPHPAADTDAVAVAAADTDAAAPTEGTPEAGTTGTPTEVAGTTETPETKAPETKAPPPVPDKPKTTRPPSVSSLVDKGWGNVDKGNLGAAATSFEKALEINPSHSDANFGYGYVLLKQGQPSLAQKHLCRALQSAGADSDVGREANGMLQANGLSCG